MWKKFPMTGLLRFFSGEIIYPPQTREFTDQIEDARVYIFYVFNIDFTSDTYSLDRLPV